MKTEKKQYLEHLNESLGFLVNSLARLMRNELETRLKESGLTPTTWTVLMALLEEDSLSQTDLGQKTFLDGATMTRALDLLEAKGYIVRSRDEGDRRVQLVILKSDGQKAALSAAQAGMEINNEVTAGFTPTERLQLVLLITRAMRRSLSKSEEGISNVA